MAYRPRPLPIEEHPIVLFFLKNQFKTKKEIAKQTGYTERRVYQVLSMYHKYMVHKKNISIDNISDSASTIVMQPKTRKTTVNIKDVKKARVKCVPSIEDFINTYDDSICIPAKIEEGIKTLLTENGEPSYMHDKEFRDICGIPINKWRRYANQYQHLQVKTPDGIFWGHPDIIEDMKDAVRR